MYTQAMDTAPKEERKAVRSTEEAQREVHFEQRIDQGQFIEAKDCMPTISECACWLICRTSVLR